MNKATTIAEKFRSLRERATAQAKERAAREADFTHRKAQYNTLSQAFDKWERSDGSFPDDRDAVAPFCEAWGPDFVALATSMRDIAGRTTARDLKLPDTLVAAVCLEALEAALEGKTAPEVAQILADGFLAVWIPGGTVDLHDGWVGAFFFVRAVRQQVMSEAAEKLLPDLLGPVGAEVSKAEATESAGQRAAAAGRNGGARTACSTAMPGAIQSVGSSAETIVSTNLQATSGTRDARSRSRSASAPDGWIFLRDAAGVARIPFSTLHTWLSKADAPMSDKKRVGQLLAVRTELVNQILLEHKHERLPDR